MNESLALAAAVSLPLAGWLVSYLWNKYGKEPIMDKLLTDKDFLKELAEILEEEGGIDEFMKKYKPRMKQGDEYDPGIMWMSGGYNGVRWITHIAGNNVHQIIDKILDSQSVKDWAKKNKIKNLKSLGNGLYFILTSSNFKNTYAKILAASAEKEAKKMKKENKSIGTISLKSLLPKQ